MGEFVMKAKLRVERFWLMWNSACKLRYYDYVKCILYILCFELHSNVCFSESF